jgi:tricarballylate dehydrogenase
MDMKYDVVVVGGGNAALCAALSARQAGARVLVLERAPHGEHGGNSAFTAGAMRVAYRGVDDIRALVPDLTDEQVAVTDFGSYPAEQFFDDLARVTRYRADPDLAETVADGSFDTLCWMRDLGVRFGPIYGRQAFKVDGRFTFWGGLTIEAIGGGPGLVESLTMAAKQHGVEIWYRARGMSLRRRGRRITGIVVRRDGEDAEVQAGAVVLASGGFQANPEWRTRYLGPNWDLAKVRGTRFNTGDGIRMALDVDAAPWGNWSGCHAVGWEMNAPTFGDLRIGDSFQKHSYPFGIMVNADGRRFVDEGADFRNFTYAKYGRNILEQPGQFAWQVFDQKVAHLLRDEYHIREVTKVTASTLEELAARLDGVDPAQFLATVREYNASIDQTTPFNPNVKDGRATRGLVVPKTNWANLLDEPPFVAYAVTCGITFTFGGIRTTPAGQVLDTEAEPIEGLFACGELVGGLFYFNYPGGSGLTAGSVIGRNAGRSAGLLATGKAAPAQGQG